MTPSAPPLDSATVHRAPAWMMPYPSGVGESCIQQATPHFTTPEILAVPTESRETYAKYCLVSFPPQTSMQRNHSFHRPITYMDTLKRLLGKHSKRQKEQKETRKKQENIHKEIIKESE